MNVVCVNDGKLIGEILTINNCWCTCNSGWSFIILDENGNELCLLERRNCCICECGNNVDFNIFIDGVDTGNTITKLWRGWLTEIFTNFDSFCIDVPDQLKNNRNAKILLIALVMLLDLKFFEQQNNSNQ